jgi:hypothetical protein
MPRETEAVLEPDDRPLIEPEQVSGIGAETSAPQVAVEAVSELEARTEPRQRQRGRQIQHTEVGFRKHQRSIVTITHGRRRRHGLTVRCGGGRHVLRGCRRRQRGEEGDDGERDQATCNDEHS